MVDTESMSAFTPLTKEQSPPALRQVQEFVTKVWNHPLVDEKTRTHRLEARTKLEKYLDTNNVPQSDYFSVPVGSLLWNTTDSSDYDYVLCLKNKELWEKLYGQHIPTGSTPNKSMIGANQLSKQGLDLLAGPEYLTGNIENDAYFLKVLLFTPDEFIGGNLELAQKLRLALVEYYVAGGPSEERQRLLEQYFQIRVNWEKQQKFSELKAGVPTIRQQRFDRVLHERAMIATRSKPERDPDDYKRVFENARKNMHVPSIQTYLEAMRESGGKLSLLKPNQQRVVTQALP
ncbi:hypothetical protein HZC27_02980 [Candidatus Roizmanbacteria bacterium]|nr:hypothetical protein [Candidatus Roizmanbacteria bacterium]